MKSLNKFLTTGGIITALSLLLTQCDLVTTSTSEFLFPPKVVDFPLGEGKTISYPLTSWIDKPYVITLKTEYINSQKAWDKKTEMPYRFSVQCYRLEKSKKNLIFEDIYIVRDISYEVGNEIHTTRENIFDDGHGWEPNYPNWDGGGRSAIIGNFRLPYGKYRCDFKDESPEKIKGMMKDAGIVRTAISIYSFKRFIY